MSSRSGVNVVGPDALKTCLLTTLAPYFSQRAHCTVGASSSAESSSQIAIAASSSIESLETANAAVRITRTSDDRSRVVLLALLALLLPCTPSTPGDNGGVLVVGTSPLQVGFQLMLDIYLFSAFSESF
jgi:hypothetical protein